MQLLPKLSLEVHLRETDRAKWNPPKEGNDVIAVWSLQIEEYMVGLCFVWDSERGKPDKYQSGIILMRRNTEKEQEPIVLAESSWQGTVDGEGKVESTSKVDGFEIFIHLCGFMLAYCTLRAEKEKEKENRETPCKEKKN